MDGVPNMLVEMVSADLYVWDTRSMNPVEAHNKDVQDEVTKKNTKALSRTNNGSTAT